MLQQAPMPQLHAETLTYEQAKSLRDQLDREIAQKEKAARADALAQISHLVHVFNFSVDDLKPAFAKAKQSHKAAQAQAGRKVSAKYRDPATGAEWTGRGKAPTWIRDVPKDQWDAYLIQAPVTTTETTPSFPLTAGEPEMVPSEVVSEPTPEVEAQLAEAGVLAPVLVEEEAPEVEVEEAPTTTLFQTTINGGDDEAPDPVSDRLVTKPLFATTE